jgi:hypothetical protein
MTHSTEFEFHCKTGDHPVEFGDDAPFFVPSAEGTDGRWQIDLSEGTCPCWVHLEVDEPAPEWEVRMHL